MKKIVISLISIIFLIFSIKIYSLRILNHEEYMYLYRSKDELYVTSSNAPRGRILDRNGVVLVDNTYENNIVYYKNSSYTKDKEIEIASYLEDYIDIDIDEDKVKEFYLNDHDIKNLLTKKELKDYEYRKISKESLQELLMSKVTSKMLEEYDETMQKRIMIYYKMNEGYYYEGKILLKNISDEVCASIIEKDITGVTCEKSYIRDYKYPGLTNVLGKVSLIPEEEVEDYLKKGYKMNDYVGVSGLEKYYDEYLRGKDAVYKVNKDYSLKLIKEEEKGNDLVLALDIDLYNNINDIIKTNMVKAKKEVNTNYFTDTYVLVSDVKTNNIISLNGIEILSNNKDYSFKDITSKIFTSSFTVGSVIKGASHTVGYLNNAIEIGKKIKDGCIKLYNVPAKCSFKDLGYLNDIEALKMSSNYYQFKTLLNVLGVSYTPNIKVDVTEDNFIYYRDIFGMYGLGTKTNIDYPIEYTGLKGDKVSADLLLNFVIGQYDNYTALGLLSYINTIANYGTRKSLSLALKDNEVIDIVPLDKEYYDRIIEGFYEVVNSGTGLGYTDRAYNAVGKTGTSETYYSKDVTTITSSYVMYMPKDDPKYSLVVITPNIGISNQDKISFANRKMSKEISKLIYEKYISY